jgi:hypothetical protein
LASICRFDAIPRALGFPVEAKRPPIDSTHQVLSKEQQSCCRKDWHLAAKGALLIRVARDRAGISPRKSGV